MTFFARERALLGALAFLSAFSPAFQGGRAAAQPAPRMAPVPPGTPSPRPQPLAPAAPAAPSPVPAAPAPAAAPAAGSAPPTAPADSTLAQPESSQLELTQSEPAQPAFGDRPEQAPAPPYPAEPVAESPPPPNMAPAEAPWIPEDRSATLSYSTAIATGATNEFISDFSLVGINLDLQLPLRRRFALGTSLGWQVLYGKSDQLSVIGDITLSGVQVRHLNTFPLLLSGRFYPNGQGYGIKPYVGFGTGIYPSEWRADISLLALSSVTVHFGFSPEIGILVPAGRGSFALTAKYHYAFESGGNPEISYFAFMVGGRL